MDCRSKYETSDNKLIEENMSELTSDLRIGKDFLKQLTRSFSLTGKKSLGLHQEILFIKRCNFKILWKGKPQNRRKHLFSIPPLLSLSPSLTPSILLSPQPQS